MVSAIIKKLYGLGYIYFLTGKTQWKCFYSISNNLLLGKISPKWPIMFLGFLATVHFNIHLFCISSPGQDVCHQCFFQLLTDLLYTFFLFPFQKRKKKTPKIWQIVKIWSCLKSSSLFQSLNSWRKLLPLNFSNCFYTCRTNEVPSLGQKQICTGSYLCVTENSERIHLCQWPHPQLQELQVMCPGTVAPTCNPSYLEGRGRRNPTLKTGWATQQEVST